MEAELKVQRQFRLVLGKDAVEALEAAVALVNGGVDAVSISKTELATYLFKHAQRFLSKNELSKIRDEFFDERKALDKLIRDSEEAGKLPDEIRKLLKEQFRATQEARSK